MLGSPASASLSTSSPARQTITVISDAPPKCLSALASDGIRLIVHPAGDAVPLGSAHDGNVLVIDGRALHAIGMIRTARLAVGSLPILFLAPSLDTVVAAVAAGANDYALLTSSAADVALRCQLLANGSVRPVSRLRKIGNLRLDRRARTLSNGTRTVTLSPIELKLLERLLLHAGRPVSRNELRRSIWHQDEIAKHPTNIAEVYVSYLRKKLAAIGGACTIRTIVYEGYALELESPPVHRRTSAPHTTRRAAK
jgi:DNA-binding response OmpR family regulator